MNRCIDCDRLLAAENDHPAGCCCDACMGMCWREWNADICIGPPVDWRARALAAEERVKRIKLEIADQPSSCVDYLLEFIADLERGAPSR